MATRRRSGQLRLRAVFATLAAAAVLVLGGCFSMGPVPPSPDLTEAPRPDGHDAARFDIAASAEVESDWGADGTFVLLHPTLNGRDVGWFIFDTGASGCTITAQAAERAGLPAIGTTLLQGQTRTTVYRCEVLRVGPLELAGLGMSGLNMSGSAQAFGREMAGILGRNVCSGAIVELDGPRRAVRLHDLRGDSEIDSLPFSAVEMKRNLPHVRCAYAGTGEGWFMIDTGANVAVHFAGSTVERSGLMRSPGVRITGGTTQITFGSNARISQGTIEDFRIGRQQCGPLEATFAEHRSATSAALQDADGLIGMGLMRRYSVYLNEPQGRVVFLAGPPAGE